MKINTELYLNTQDFTASRVYETSTLSVPEGYEVVDFRIPKTGDSYISRMDSYHAIRQAAENCVYLLPLLIVKKSPPPLPPPYRYEKVVTIKDIYKTETPRIPLDCSVSDFRIPKVGDFILTSSFMHVYGPIDIIDRYTDDDPRLILKLRDA